MTRFQRLTCFFLVLTIFFWNKAFNQTNDFASQENRFAELYSKLFSFGQVDYDSINFYSKKFGKKFTSFIRTNPNTLSYSFRKLIDSNYCQIRTSSNGKFRIYSWDTWKGGTMHEFNAIYQWRENGKVFSKVETLDDDPGSFCSKLFTIDVNGKPYYLAIRNAIYSTKDARQSIAVYSIENGKLTDTVKLFKTKTKRLNRIDVDFDFFSVVDRPERPLELITYDDKQRIIYIPVVGDKGQVTTRNILYQLKGKYFRFIGIQTGKRK